MKLTLSITIALLIFYIYLNNREEIEQIKTHSKTLNGNLDTIYQSKVKLSPWDAYSSKEIISNKSKHLFKD